MYPRNKSVLTKSLRSEIIEVGVSDGQFYHEVNKLCCGRGFFDSIVCEIIPSQIVSTVSRVV